MKITKLESFTAIPLKERYLSGAVDMSRLIPSISGCTPTKASSVMAQPGVPARVFPLKAMSLCAQS